jgi:hypothetical protein
LISLKTAKENVWNSLEKAWKSLDFPWKSLELAWKSVQKLGPRPLPPYSLWRVSRNAAFSTLPMAASGGALTNRARRALMAPIPGARPAASPAATIALPS